MPRMPPTRPRLGAHLPLGGGMVKAVERAREIGAEALQIWGDNPTAWRRRSAPPAEQERFRELLRAYDIGPIAIHAPYLVNLAGPEPRVFERSVQMLSSELLTAPGFLGRYVNVHIGSHRGSGVEAGVARLVEGLGLVLARAEEGAAAPDGEAAPPDADTADAADAAPPMIVLENASGSGFGLGVTVAELAAIADAAEASGLPRDRIGFCLDTAHAWGAGIDVGTPAVADAFLADFDARIGLDRLVMVHLNDSRSELGSGLDRHEHLGAGRIGAVGLGHLVRHQALAHATFYIETPGMDEGYDAVNMARARDLLACRPLPDLPPEALEVTSSSRARTGPPEGPVA